MHSQNLSNSTAHSKHYDEFMHWFRHNYPNFFDLYAACVEASIAEGSAADICKGTDLSKEENDFLLSIIDLYNKQNLKQS